MYSVRGKRIVDGDSRRKQYSTEELATKAAVDKKIKTLRNVINNRIICEAVAIKILIDKLNKDDKIKYTKELDKIVHITYKRRTIIQNKKNKLKEGKQID
jgi:hypothetical protein